jgi:hypothetical protein
MAHNSALIGPHDVVPHVAHVLHASAPLKIFVRHPKKTFATELAVTGHSRWDSRFLAGRSPAIAQDPAPVYFCNILLVFIPQD